MFYSDDPARDFARQDMEQARREARLPVCDSCNKRIHDEHYFDLLGEFLCEKCVIRKYRHDTEDFIEID